MNFCLNDGKEALKNVSYIYAFCHKISLDSSFIYKRGEEEDFHDLLDNDLFEETFSEVDYANQFEMINFDQLN